MSLPHVDRSKLFAFERLEKAPNIDAARIAEAIEMTRFPVPQDAKGASERLEPNLAGCRFHRAAWRSAGARKANALYCEFEEIGMNRALTNDGAGPAGGTSRFRFKPETTGFLKPREHRA
jgi:hypothetical protein